MSDAWTAQGIKTRRGALTTGLALLAALLGVLAAPPAHGDDVTVSSGFPRLSFDDTDDPGVEWQWVGDASGISLSDAQSGGVVPFSISSSPSTGDSLVVASNGDVHLAINTLNVTRATGRVGIRTQFPMGDIHISGTETQDLFSAMGPDPVNGPAFNFGYAGSSFGRGSGFFNVRPDAQAAPPNPSLRFATNNLQRMIIDNAGRVGIGAPVPAHPLQMASGARVTAGGVWTDASSREYKQDIAPLAADAAVAALGQLAPVTFAYRADPAERHVGFVAEDVPALVATADRKGLSPMDVVAVLTRVVQEQQRMVQEQQRLVQEQQAAMARLEAEVAELRRAAGR
jgi:hypothetical protein